MINLPALFINFKTYHEATGSNAVELALLCEKLSAGTGKTIVVVPSLSIIMVT